MSLRKYKFTQHMTNLNKVTAGILVTSMLFLADTNADKATKTIAGSVAGLAALLIWIDFF